MFTALGSTVCIHRYSLKSYVSSNVSMDDFAVMSVFIITLIIYYQLIFRRKSDR